MEMISRFVFCESFRLKRSLTKESVKSEIVVSERSMHWRDSTRFVVAQCLRLKGLYFWSCLHIQYA